MKECKTNRIQATVSEYTSRGKDHQIKIKPILTLTKERRLSVRLIGPRATPSEYTSRGEDHQIKTKPILTLIYLHLL